MMMARFRIVFVSALASVGAYIPSLNFDTKDLVRSCTGPNGNLSFSWQLQDDGLELKYTLHHWTQTMPQTIQMEVTSMAKTYNSSEKTWAQSAEVVVLNPNWLRERCLAKECVDQDSLQPLHDPHDVASVKIQDVQLVEEDFEHDGSKPSFIITFSDNIKSEFPVSTLVAEISDGRHVSTQAMNAGFPNVRLWDASLHVPPSFDFMTFHVYREKFISTVLTTGIALLSNMPQQEGFCTKFGRSISTVRVTEWGDEFNVRTVPDNEKGDVVKKDLAYTPLGIGLHTDNPYRDPMPDYQLLHQIEGCTCDGPMPCPPTCNVENIFSDGFAVAQALKREDPEAFKLLTEIPVRWENNGGDMLSGGLLITNKPIIELQYENGNPCVFADCIHAIRFSAKSGGYAPIMDPETTQKFYAAKRKFSQMLADPVFVIRLHMKPGEMVVFDNKRILHGRSYVQSDKARFVQGCYINRDGLWYQFAKAQKSSKLPRFSALKEASKEQFEHIGEKYALKVDALVLQTFYNFLNQQIGNTLGQPVDLYEHGLQTASRAYRAGESTDIVIMSLFHDMTETMVAKNHGEAAAGFLEPYLNPKAIWMLRKHEEFQGFYYFHYFGGNREVRQQYADHQWYQDLVDWCEKYDQASFDMYYPSLPLSFFEPIVNKVFRRQPFWWDLTHPKRSAVTGSAIF